MVTKKRALKLALESNREHERHHTLAETRYWCDQYKLLAQQAIEALAQPAQEPVLQEIEQYQMQMAGISSAAMGHWKEGDSIHPDYDTVSLRDVAKLYAKYDALYKAQPAQEPVVLVATNSSGQVRMQYSDGSAFDVSKHIGQSFYTVAQPAQEPDRQTLQANGTHPAPCARHCEATAFNIVIRNLEKRLEQPAQKPVYLVWFDEEMNRGWSETTKDHYEITDDEDRWLLYTAPPQRPWVGLTNNDWNSTAYDTEFRAGAEWAEAKLKQKNT